VNISITINNTHSSAEVANDKQFQLFYPALRSIARDYASSRALVIWTVFITPVGAEQASKEYT
jgi:hypothetical protein